VRVFLTGATGIVGGGVARALINRGHTVVGLARSHTTAERLSVAGVEPWPGDLSGWSVG
jgi:uncharacterized protein YbjT (DUF2867 family)